MLYRDTSPKWQSFCWPLDMTSPLRQAYSLGSCFRSSALCILSGPGLPPGNAAKSSLGVPLQGRLTKSKLCCSACLTGLPCWYELLRKDKTCAADHDLGNEHCYCHCSVSFRSKNCMTVRCLSCAMYQTALTSLPRQYVCMD